MADTGWQSFHWTLRGPYTFLNTSEPDTVQVTGTHGYAWWKKRVVGHLRLSRMLPGWFWVESGVELRLAPQYVITSLQAALEVPPRATVEEDRG